MIFSGRADDLLCSIVRALPREVTLTEQQLHDLLPHAERHGVAGVLLDAVPSSRHVGSHALMREVARELDFSASVRLLDSIDGAFTKRGLAAVVLKGVPFAVRFYSRPAARATSDLDLLVAERDLDTAVNALTSIGFEAARGAREARFRREHHHLHLSRNDALPIELHFHAYRGFGSVLPSEPLVARRQKFGSLHSLGVLEPADELVYLAVHAAAHRFCRIGWLYDLLLLVRHLTQEEMDTAVMRARSWGYERVLAYAAHVLDNVFGDALPDVSSLGRLTPSRQRLVDATLSEPTSAVNRWFTRLVYGVLLSTDVSSAARYANAAAFYSLRRVLNVPGT